MAGTIRSYGTRSMAPGMKGFARRTLRAKGSYRALTAEGYTKKRTGATYPLSLNLDQLPNTIAQIIHNVSLRPAAVEVGKLVYDNKINQALTMKLGEEYKSMFQPWLKDIVNPRNFTGGPTIQALHGMLETLRSNIQVSLIGLNPSTPLKHGPTALSSSVAEVGAGPFIKQRCGALVKSMTRQGSPS